MKIISGHDYYDGAGYGVDETIVFVRKEFETWESPFELPASPERYRYRASTISFHLVLVAGKVYPAIREEHPVENTMGWTDSKIIWHYDLASALESLERLHFADDGHIYRARLRNWTGKVTRHFEQKQKQSWTNWMIENRVITGLVSTRYKDIHHNGTFVRANISDLKDLQFCRLLDPATIHMEIANFIGGVLPSSKDTIELRDIDKIRKAGFDTKSSFRQDPGVKKPRRRRS